MMQALKAEFRKLLTVRSTYFISFLALALLFFISFYVEGFKNVPPAGAPHANLFLAGSIMHIATVVSVFAALVGLLLVTHEYRYNTIVYSLTASNSRSKVLAAKIITILVYVFFLSVILTIAGLLLIRLGAAVSGHALPHQDINYLTYVGKVLFFCEGFGMAGMLFAVLIRNQVGAIAALFILPNTVEGLLSLLLKHNSVYMPFTALTQVVQPPSVTAPGVNEASTGYLSPVHGALVFLAYVVGVWIIAWYLFLRRDAS